MKKTLIFAPACLALLLLSSSVWGQFAGPISESQARPNGYPQVNLFMHLDKAVYQPGETIWFTGYVLNRDKMLRSEQNTIYALLVNAADRKLVVKQRFAIALGIGKGYLSIPDTIPAGNYWVMGFTNACIEHGKQPIFKQLINVQTGVAAPFRVTTTSLPAAVNDTLQVKYRVTTNYNGLAAGGRFEYTVFNDSKAIDSGSRIIDPFGEVTLPVSASQSASGDLQVTARVTRGDLTKSFILPVPAAATSVATVYGSGPNNLGTHVEEIVNSAESGLYSASYHPSSPINNNAGPIVTIEPDSTEYHIRHQVRLRIRVRDAQGKPVPAIFSLAVVSAKKLDPANTPSIAEYYSQPDSIFVQPGADITPYDHLSRPNDRMPDSGYVLYDGHSPHRTISLALMGSGFSTLTTDTAGKFQLPYNALLAPSGAVHYLSVAEKEVDRYKIVVCTKADRFAGELASTYHPIDHPIVEKEEANELTAPVGAGTLQAAVVKEKKMPEYNYITGEFNSSHCEADFVCTHHHSPSGFDPDNLNCPMVRFDSCRLEKPVEGHTYLYIRDTNAVRRGGHWGVRLYKVIYHCAVPYLPNFVKALDPIELGNKDFPAETSSGGLPLGSGMQSTVFWQPAISTYGKEEEIIPFFGNTLPGKFICRIQGISMLGPIDQYATYTVLPPKN